ncbi:MAG: hypothetical protein FWF84_06105, partial [Kiritimatiellaeota bacterium]|nr:hypothetical protein [Kiritimatiellota bacterium]
HNQKIVPYLFGNDIAFAPGTGGAIQDCTSLLTYNAVEGFRALRLVEDIEGNPSEFYEDDINLAPADANVLLTSNQTLYASKTINSIMATSVTYTLSLAQDTVLTLASGVLRAPVSGDASTAVNFGDKEGFVYVYAPMAPLTGTEGVTFAALPYPSGGSLLRGVATKMDTFSGQVTFAHGMWDIGSYVYPPNLGVVNLSIPDESFVFVHPSAILRVGDNRATADYCTREIIGGLGGMGVVRLALTTATDTLAWLNSALTIGADTSPYAPADYWETWTNTAGRVLLNGGLLKPGMTEDKRGTLRFTTAISGNAPFPVELRNGTFAVAIDAELNNDSIDVQGELVIGNGDNLFLEVTLEAGAVIEAGMRWTIATAGTLTANGDTLFRKVLCNDPRWTFAVEEEGDTLVMVACRKTTGTTIMIR